MAVRREYSCAARKDFVSAKQPSLATTTRFRTVLYAGSAVASTLNVSPEPVNIFQWPLRGSSAAVSYSPNSDFSSVKLWKTRISAGSS